MRRICCLLLLSAAISFAQPTMLRTIAGGGPDWVPGPSGSLGEPWTVAFGPDGTAYIPALKVHKVFALGTDGQLRVLAGSGVQGFAGDGGPAANAALNQPSGVAADGAGNVYIADSGNNRVRKVAPDGTISTLAGTGRTGYAGDGAAATAATLYRPYGVAADQQGNVFIADTTNNVVRKVTPDGIISTVAGNTRYAFAGDGGPATSASVAQPYSVAVDGAGNLYIADYTNQRIRRVTPDGTITTFAGTGQSSFSGDQGQAASAALSSPMGVAVDGSGNVYIADSGNRRIRKVTAAGVISTVAGTGNLTPVAENIAATTAAMSTYGVGVDSLGNVYLADGQNHRVRRVAATDGRIATVAGNGQISYSGDGGEASRSAMDGPAGVVSDGRFLYFSDTENHRVRKIDLESGNVTLVAGEGLPRFGGDNGPAIAASLNRPTGLALNKAGELFIADYMNHRVRKVDKAGVITTVAGTSSSGTGSDGVPATQSSMYEPVAIAFDDAQNLYVAERYNYRVRRITPDGIIRTIIGTDRGGGPPADGAQAAGSLIGYPRGVAVDPQGNVYVSDNSLGKVYRISNGVVTTVAGNGRSSSQIGDGGAAANSYIYGPEGLATDDQGNLYIAEASSHRVRKVNAADGTISTIAGTSTAGFNGDGSNANNYQVNGPRAVTWSAPCILYITDTENARVRRVRPLIGYTINSVPEGLQLTVDGQVGGSPLPFSWEATTVHTVEAPSPQAGAEGVRYVFPEKQYIVVPCAPETQTVNFQFNTEYLLAIEATEGGKVDVESGYRNAGSEVTLTPVPAEGYRFAGWEGACTGGEGCTVLMDAPKSVKAKFEPAG